MRPLTYGVYAIALAYAGFGLWFGVLSGPAPVGLTLIPAAIATAVILVVLSMLATIAVLGYRTISYRLPTVPGIIAYFHLRHDLGNRSSASTDAEE